MRRALVVTLALWTPACASDEPAAPPSPPPAPAIVDAGVAPAAPIDAGATAIPHYDPASGFHLDDDLPATAARRGDRAAPREQRRIQLILQSTPGGAIAAVDGDVIGRTPVFWEGEFTGREREFTFVLPGHAMARYRFVPVRDGFVHGRLERIADGAAGDAGVPEIPAPAPRGHGR